MNLLNESSWPAGPGCFYLAIQVVEPNVPLFHAAVLYMNDGELMIGDLQSHKQTRRAVARPNNRMFWTSLQLSIDDQKILATKLDAWLTLNENAIPYSVAHPGGIVFKDDVWIGKEPGQGLTCATFVIELFKELCIPFVDAETWQSREGDEEWARAILDMIGDGMPEDHRDAQLERIGTTIRIRPSDVFAAGQLLTTDAEEPLTFNEVSPQSERVERSSVERCGNFA